jgi:hypothetical protein
MDSQKLSGAEQSLEVKKLKRMNFSLIGLFILLLLFVCSGILFLPIPFTRDQGIYAYVAWCWLGEWWPYQYAFEHKGPWLYLVYAIFLKLSQGAMWGVNLADLLSRMSTVSLLWFFTKKAFNHKIAFLSAFFCSLSLLGIFSSCWWNAQAETFIIALSALSVLFAWYAVKSFSAIARGFFSLLSGLALSQMLMFKPSGFWLVAGIFLFLTIFAEDRKKAILSYGIGIFVGLSLWLFYFWLRGIGREFFEEVVVFNLFHFSGARKPAKILLRMLGWELWRIFGWGLVLAPVGLWLSFKKRKQPEYFLALVWFVCAVLEVFLQARFFLYHLLLLVAPGGLVLAIGAQGWDGRFQRVWKALTLVVILAFLFGEVQVYFLIQRHYQTWDYLRGRIDRGQYYARFQEAREGERDFNAYASWVVGNWIRERTTQEDYVLVFGYEPGINYIASRRSPSRFHSDYPLDSKPKTQFALRVQKRWQKLFLEELNKRNPRLVVLVHNDTNAIEPVDSYHQAMQFREFWEWLLKNYQKGEKIEDFEFWWRME